MSCNWDVIRRSACETRGCRKGHLPAAHKDEGKQPVTHKQEETLQGCLQQIALQAQDLPPTCLAHHELESMINIIIYKKTSSCQSSVRVCMTCAETEVVHPNIPWEKS